MTSWLGVQGFDGFLDGAVEGLGIGEGLVSEVVGFEFALDALDVVEFGAYLGSHSTF